MAPQAPRPAVDSSQESYDLDDLYQGYFDEVPKKPRPTGIFGANAELGQMLGRIENYDRSQALQNLAQALDLIEPDQDLGPSYMHRLRDPTYLIPTRAAPKPPVARPAALILPVNPPPGPPPPPPDPILNPVILVTPPLGANMGVGVPMANEVRRWLVMLAKENSRITRCRQDCLERHLVDANACGEHITTSLQRLHRVAHNHRAFKDLYGCLPAVQGILAQHMLAVITVSQLAEPPSFFQAMQQGHTARHAPGLHVSVGRFEVVLPLCLSFFMQLEEHCEEPHVLRSIGLFYRTLKELANRLPPGGNSRGQIHLPHKIYTIYPTPGQMALEWNTRANVVFGRYNRLTGGSAPSTSTLDDPPTALRRSRTSRPGA